MTAVAPPTGGSARGLLLHGARILTMDRGRPSVEAVSIRDGRILAAGDRVEVRGALPDGATELDLGGGALLPGFIDAHHHYGLAALDRRAPDLRLPPGSSVDELLERVAAATPAVPGRWVRAHGYDPALLRERRPPTAAELDAVCPDGR